MKKAYWVICCEYRKIKKPKISYLLEETLILFIICSKCKNEDEKLFKKNNQWKFFKILGLIQNM